MTIIVLLTSFTATESLRFPPQGYSLRWYKALLDADQMQAAAWNSLVVAVWTTLACVVLGTAGALGIARSASRFARIADVMFMSPLILPALAFGFAALVYIHLLGFHPSIPLLIVGHVIVCVPFVLRTTIAALAQVDPALFAASASLDGAHCRACRGYRSMSSTACAASLQRACASKCSRLRRHAFDWPMRPSHPPASPTLPFWPRVCS